MKEYAGTLAWLDQDRQGSETAVVHPLAVTGVATAAFFELGMDLDQTELLFLLLRLPGAAAHALEQREYGWRRFPFFGDGLQLVDQSDLQAS